MIRNSKPKTRELNNEQIELLNNIGFYVDSFSGKEKVGKNSMCFEKAYECCGGIFDLLISIEEKYTFCGEECGDKVVIHTPYNNWWCDNWTLQEFSKSMENFQKELKEDLKKLRKIGIIS